MDHPYEIVQIFDGISYNKGSSVIHMLASFIGREAFRNGMEIYLNRHRYQNACTAAADLDNVYCIDSKNLCMGMGLLVLRACDLRDRSRATRCCASRAMAARSRRRSSASSATPRCRRRRVRGAFP